MRRRKRGAEGARARREREEAREGRGAGEAKDRTRNGAVPGRAHFGRAHNNINIMSRSGRARGKREEGTAEKTRADGGEDRRSGRRGRREERSAEKTGGADGGEGGTKRQKNDRKRQDAARQPVGLATSGLQRITPEKPAFPPRRITDCNRKNENISPKIPLFQKNTYLC